MLQSVASSEPYQLRKQPKGDWVVSKGSVSVWSPHSEEKTPRLTEQRKRIMWRRGKYIVIRINSLWWTWLFWFKVLVQYATWAYLCIETQDTSVLLKANSEDTSMSQYTNCNTTQSRPSHSLWWHSLVLLFWKYLIKVLMWGKESKFVSK